MSPAAKVSAIDQEFEQAMASFSTAYESAGNPEEQRRINGQQPKPEAWFPRLFAIARAEPKDPASMDALIWIVKHTRDIGLPEALSLLMRDHLDALALTDSFFPLEFAKGPEPEAFLRTVLSGSPHRGVRGHAAFALGELLGVLAARSRFVQHPEDYDVLRPVESQFGAAEVARLKSIKPEEIEKQAEAMFVEVTSTYADVSGMSGRSLGESAARCLFEIRNLAVGKVAPEIEGEDIDGKPMRLSDFRGKIVVLDFWGHW